VSDVPWRRIGLFLFLFAVGGSAIGLTGWLFLLSRKADSETYGLDTRAMQAPAAAAVKTAAAPSFLDLDPSMQISAQEQRPGSGKNYAGAGIIGSARTESANRAGNRKAEAARVFKDAVGRHETLVESFIRRMEAKHPSLTKYGEDWAASPELCAARDQYWTDKDPLEFIHSLAKSDDFSKLVKKYARDPGIHDALITGIKEAPPSLMDALSGVLSSDEVAEELAETVAKNVGLPADMTSSPGGADPAPATQERILSDVMDSEEMKKAMRP